VRHSAPTIWASFDATADPQFGRVGKQVIENTGPRDTKRMETIDEEFLAAANAPSLRASPWAMEKIEAAIGKACYKERWSRSLVAFCLLISTVMHLGGK
jgi:hypothetical protein